MIRQSASPGESSTEHGTTGKGVRSGSEGAQFLLLHKTTLLNEATALVIFVTMVLILRFNAFRYLSTGFMGGASRDAGLVLWIVRSHLDHLFSLPWFNTTAFYPYTGTLAWSDAFLLPALFVWPFSVLHLPLQLGYNLMLLGATVLSGYLTYRLAFRLSGSFLPSIAAGTAFMTLPFLSGSLGHPHLQLTFFLPLVISAFFSCIAQPTVVRGALLALIINLCFATTAYYAVFGVAAIATLFVLLIIVRPHAFSAGELLRLALGGIAGSLPLLFLLPPYLAIRDVFGERELFEAYYFSASFLSYLSSTPLSLWYSSTASLSHSEAHLFPGALVLLGAIPAFLRISQAKSLWIPALIAVSCLVAVAIFSILSQFSGNAQSFRYLVVATSFLSLGAFAITIYRMGKLERRLGFEIVTNRALIALCLGCALILFLVSLGPLGNPEKGSLALGLYRVFYELMPGFNSARCISRIGILVALFLSLAGSLILAQLSESHKQLRFLSMLLPALIFIENLPSQTPMEDLPPKPDVFRRLSTVPNLNDAVIVLPWAKPNKVGRPDNWGDFAEWQVFYMNSLVKSGWQTVNGYSGQISKIMREYPRLMAGFPSESSVQTLCSIAGLRYLIYASSQDEGFEQSRFMDRLGSFADSVRYVEADEDGNYLFELPCFRKLSESTQLLTPSSPRGTVYLEIMGLIESGAPPSLIEIWGDAGDGTGEYLITAIEVPADGEWETYPIKIEDHFGAVRPLKMTFKTGGQRTIYLRSSRYEITENRDWFERFLASLSRKLLGKQ